jgi:uncharacterized membrane protein YbhN (UPF0104 family)
VSTEKEDGARVVGLTKQLIRRLVGFRYASPLLAIALLVVIAAYLVTNRQVLEPIAIVSRPAIALLALSRITLFVVNGLFLDLFTQRFGLRLLMKEWLGLSIITSLGNYLTPFSGGMLTRAAYLKGRHGFAYSTFLSVVSSNYLLVFLVIGVVGAVASIRVTDGGTSANVLAAFFVLVTVCISLVFLVRLPTLPERNRYFRAMSNALRGWETIRHDRSLLSRLVILTLVNLLTNGMSYWLAYSALGVNIGFRPALLISLATSFSFLISITPANLGIQEAAVGVVAEFVNGGAAQGIVAALLVRAVTIALLLALGPLSAYLLLAKSGK